MNDRPKDIYIKGVSLKKPAPTAPDFVKFKMSIELGALKQWLAEQKAAGNILTESNPNGKQWINIDVKEPWPNSDYPDSYNLVLNQYVPPKTNGQTNSAVSPEFTIFGDD
jgi:hypothetical protein